MKIPRSFIVMAITGLVAIVLTVSLAFAQGESGNPEAVEFGATSSSPSSGGGTMCTGSGGSVGIIHDDGVFENGYSGNPAVITTVTNVDLFNPVSTEQLAYTRFCVGLVSLAGPDLDFEIVFFDNDGSGDAPGTELASVAASAANLPGGLPCAWYEYDLTNVLGLPTGADGDIYIGVRYNPMDFPSRFTCADESVTTPLWTGYIRFNDNAWGATESTFPGYRAMSHRVEMESLAAGFTSNTPVELGQTSVFTNTSTGTGTLSYEWDFDDGSAVVTDTNPTHLYTAVGEYTVTLTVTNELVSDTVTQTYVVLEALVAGFTSNTPVELGDTSVFTNTSTGSGTLSYEWDFGDDSTVVTDTNPTHIYTATGEYTVTLTVTNEVGSDTVTQTHVVLEVPTAGFTSNTPVELGDTSVFTNTSTGGGTLSYEWDFGDGSAVVTDMNPTHVYTATGEYTVTLTVTNEVGSDTVVQTHTVVVSSYELYLVFIIKP